MYHDKAPNECGAVACSFRNRQSFQEGEDLGRSDAALEESPHLNSRRSSPRCYHGPTQTN